MEFHNSIPIPYRVVTVLLYCAVYYVHTMFVCDILEHMYFVIDLSSVSRRKIDEFPQLFW